MQNIVTEYFNEEISLTKFLIFEVIYQRYLLQKGHWPILVILAQPLQMQAVS